MTHEIGRRDLLKAGAALTVAATLPGAAVAADARPEATRKRVLRMAHLTDIHVKPEAKADQGMTAALRHVAGLKDKPDVLLQGGDYIMDALAATEERTKVQFDLANRILKDECSIPVRHCIGNHDIWGYNLQKSGTTGSEPKWGKVWALEAMELEKPYYSYDQAGWHFVVLDTVQPRDDGGYKAIMDEEQFEWFAGDIAATRSTTPIMIISHIPILSVGAYFYGKDTEKDGQWKVISVLMMLDARRFKDLFIKHPNVKLCLAGHIHLLDRIEYNGVTYITSGAVCGSWWGGAFQETQETYGLVNLYDDGSFDYESVDYGWDVPKKEEKKA